MIDWQQANNRERFVRNMAILAAGFLVVANHAAADTVVVSADRMLDVIAGRVIERPQITITDGRISAVAGQGSPERGASSCRG